MVIQTRAAKAKSHLDRSFDDKTVGSNTLLPRSVPR